MKIEVGDEVTIQYSNGDILRTVTVLYVPQDVGDMWHFYWKLGKEIFYQNSNSSNLDKIILEKKHE